MREAFDQLFETFVRYGVFGSVVMIAVPAFLFALYVFPWFESRRMLYRIAVFCSKSVVVIGAYAALLMHYDWDHLKAYYGIRYFIKIHPVQFAASAAFLVLMHLIVVVWLLPRYVLPRKFSPGDWHEANELEKERMLEDLIEHRLHTQMKADDVRAMLGEPELAEDHRLEYRINPKLRLVIYFAADGHLSNADCE